jgi:hypothetical protein
MLQYIYIYMNTLCTMKNISFNTSSKPYSYTVNVVYVGGQNGVSNNTAYYIRANSSTLIAVCGNFADNYGFTLGNPSNLYYVFNGGRPPIYCADFADSNTVYIGGNFIDRPVGNANYIIKYTISTGTFTALGTGPIAGLRSRPFAIYGASPTNVYITGFATGGMTINGGSGIIMWNGSSFDNLSGGISGSTVLCVHGLGTSPIFAGGQFGQTIGGHNNIARWNGSTWSSMSGGVTGNSVDGNTPSVRAIYALDSTRIYVGGTFSTAGTTPCANIAMWNNTTSTWTPLGTGTNGMVTSIYAANQFNVFVGGSFTTAGGITVNYIAKWNGSSWYTVVGTGANVGANNSVSTIHGTSATNIFVGGSFTTLGGVTVNRIARLS